MAQGVTQTRLLQGETGGLGRREWCRGRDSNPHALGAADFESAVSAISPPRRGAGEGNRTLVTSLEGWGSAIELHPRVGRNRLTEGPIIPHLPPSRATLFSSRARERAGHGESRRRVGGVCLARSGLSGGVGGASRCGVGVWGGGWGFWHFVHVVDGGHKIWGLAGRGG